MLFILYVFVGMWGGVNNSSAVIELRRVYRVHLCVLTFKGRNLAAPSNDNEHRTHAHIHTSTSEDEGRNCENRTA